MPGQELPKIIVSSVIRATNRGESHGGLYMVDLNSGQSEQILNWDSANISFRDRGSERGLRGLSFHDRHCFVTIHDKVMVYDEEFKKLDEFGNRYLGDCHETWVDNNQLLISSTAYDSVLTFDITKGAFVHGICFRNQLDRIINKALWKTIGIKRTANLAARSFDPNADDGPREKDELHINNVTVQSGVIHVSSHRAKWLYAVNGDRLERVARLPFKTHNARLFRDGVIFSNTGNSEVTYIGLA